MRRYQIYEVVPDGDRRKAFESVVERIIKPLLTSFDNVTFVSDDVDGNDKLFRFRINDMNETCLFMQWYSYYGNSFRSGFSTSKTAIDGHFAHRGTVDGMESIIAFDVLIFSQNNKLYGLAFVGRNGNPNGSDKSLYIFHNVNDIPVASVNGGDFYQPQVLDGSLATYSGKITGYFARYNTPGKAIVSPAFMCNLEGDAIIQNEVDFLRFVCNDTLIAYSFNEISINGEKYYQCPLYYASCYPMYIKGGD